MCQMERKLYRNMSHKQNSEWMKNIIIVDIT